MYKTEMANSISEKFVIPIDVGKDHEMQKEQIPKTDFDVCTSTKKSLPSHQRLPKLVYREGCDVEERHQYFYAFFVICMCPSSQKAIKNVSHPTHVRKENLKAKVRVP